MMRDPATFTSTQALDRAHALNHTSFELAHMAREQAGSQAGTMIEVLAQLIQAEYYNSLIHLQACLNRAFPLDLSQASSGLSTEMPETLPAGSSTETPS